MRKLIFLIFAFSLTFGCSSPKAPKSYVSQGGYKSDGLSLNDIMEMSPEERKEFYFSLTDSLPDLWCTMDVDETTYLAEDSIPTMPSDEIIYLNYRQQVNGYRVMVEFIRAHSDLDYGRAIIHFSKPGHSFQVYCGSFTDYYLRDFNNSFYNDSCVDLSKYSAGDSVSLNYFAPLADEYLSDQSPFYFRDMDFDGEEELVVNNIGMGGRGYNEYDVFKVYGVEKPLRLKGKPFYSGSRITNYNVDYEPQTESILDKCYDGVDAYGFYRYQSVKVHEKKVFQLAEAMDMGFYHLKDKKASDSINLLQPYKEYKRVNGKLVITGRGVFESGNYGWNQNEISLPVK